MGIPANPRRLLKNQSEGKTPKKTRQVENSKNKVRTAVLRRETKTTEG